MKVHTGKRRLSRRTFLRGTSSIAIALPFLAEMAPSRSVAQAEVPTRLVTAFFGLGLDPSWQNDFSGPLEPLAPFRDKMAAFSVDLVQGNVGGAHCNTSTVVFVGERQRSVNRAGGASIDQLLRAEVDPSAPTLASGLWWRRGACDAQALRVFGLDGNGRPPVKRPSEVFDRVFGSYRPPPSSTEPPPPADSPERRARRIERSVLDTVLGQYRSLTGDRSYLGAESKLKLTQHLNSIREIELSLAPADDVIDMGDPMPPMGATCDVPDVPRDPSIADYDRFTYGTGDGAPRIDWQDVQMVFGLHAQLYAMALRCDLVRYGNLMFESAGGHTNLGGTYRAMGESTDFPGNSQHDSYFHGNQPREARLYQHFALSSVAAFLEALDDDDFREANGATVLENATIVLGTEYGWNHNKTDVFHAVFGGGERFQRGFFTDRRMNGIDLYNAILRGHGIEAGIGSASGIASGGDGNVLLT